jgi:hypothetical protein
MTIIEQASALTEENAKNKFADLPSSDGAAGLTNNKRSFQHTN